MSNYKIDLQTNNAIINSNNLSLQELLNAVNNLPEAGSGGIELPELINEGTASDLLAGKELIDSTGNVVTGTIQNVDQATPTISVDSAGKITASVTQTEGYVTAGTKSGTKQLTTKAAKTITPTKSTQTAVAKNVYTTGVITVGAIPDEYIVPSGSLSITTTGQHDVTSYAEVNVDIETGVDTSDSTASANEILSGETAYIGSGKVTGTMPNNGTISKTMDGITTTSVSIPAGYTSGGSIGLDDTILNEANEQSDLLDQVLDAANSLPNANENSGSGDNITLQEKTVTPTTSSQNVTADSGYDGLSKVTVNAIQTEMKTITPTTSEQNIIPSNGKYLSAVTVEAIPSNYIVPSGTLSITENGTHDITNYSAVNVNISGAGVSGSESESVAALLMNTLVTLDNSIATSLRARACQQCTKLVTVNLPLVTSLGNYAFYQCSGLETVKLPKLTSMSTQVFYSCTKLKHADCGQVANIPAQSFNACSALTELILRKTNAICTLSNVNGVNNSPIGNGTGYIYVPAALIEQYKAATNWSTFAAQFRSIEDYPEICGI